MKQTRKSMTTWLPIGMCLGAGAGIALGFVFGSIPLGLLIGVALGTGFGALTGSSFDKSVNEQLEEKGYQVKSISGPDDSKNFQVLIASKTGEEQRVTVNDTKMGFSQFKPGDYVFLNSTGSIDQAYGSREREAE